MADDTDRKLPAHLNPELKFKPGVSGNPAGRPKGARSKLGEAFLQALNKDFAEHGAKVIETVRAEKPDQYLKVIASILPKEISGLDGEPIEFRHRDMSDAPMDVVLWLAQQRLSEVSDGDSATAH